MSVQNRCRSRLLVLLPLIVIFELSATACAVAQTSTGGQSRLNAAQKAELENATQLNRQVIELYGQGKYEAATVIAERVLKIRERLLGPEHPNTAGSLSNLASLYKSRGNYAAAEPLHQRALKIQEKVLGPEHPHTLRSLNNLATLAISQANYAIAEPLLLRVLKIKEKNLGANDASTADSLNNLAILYKSQGNYAAAEPLYQRALKIDEKVLGPEHPNIASDLNNMAEMYKSQGKYSVAEPLLQRALTIREKILGPEHTDTATSLNNMAGLQAALGNESAAESLYQRALPIYEKSLGPEHPSTAAIVNNLAMTYRSQRKYSAAEPLFQRALAFREKVLGHEHPDTASSLNNLACLYQLERNYAAAEPLYQRALKIWERVLGHEHPNVASGLNNLALLHESQGNDATAERLYHRALKIRESVLGADHPDTASSLNNLAMLYAKQGKVRQAMSVADQARKAQRAHVSRVLPALSAQAQEMFLRTKYENSFHKALSLALSQNADADATQLSVAWLINGKGVAQDALAQRNMLTRDVDDPKLAPVVKQLQNVRSQLAALAMNAADAGKAEERRNRLAELAAEEQRLANQLGSGSSNATADWIELSQIRNALPPGTVLIDIARFDVWDFTATGREPSWQAARYAAWISPSAGQADTVLIDLGDAEAIDELVEEVRQQIAADAAKGGSIATDGEEPAAKKLTKSLSALAKLIWQPLAQHVGDATQIILSPDGALWLVPWTALPVDESGDEYLLERYNVRMVVSGRDLITKSDGRAARPPVILANPEFDQAESRKKSAINGIFKRLPPEDDNGTRSYSAESTLPKVKPLPNTGIEALAIQPHIESYTGQKVSLYKEQYALEQVAKVLHGPKIATFATHGFFLPKQKTKLNDRDLLMTDNSRAVVLDTDGKPIENPLLRCGLLLSGCNNRGASVGNDDGILTGMEVVGIDFRGTELVVLSACETGIGDVRNGEGVAGLRQAFQLAGAEAVMATLWTIPDRDSAILMSSFFKHLADGQSKAEALRSAQMELIEKRRSRYGAAHPFYWAAFTLTGK